MNQEYDLCGAQSDVTIAADARVLEVGGGDSPSPRSDFLVDFALEGGCGARRCRAFTFTIAS